MTVRDDARNAQKVTPAFAVRIEVERCANVYGVAPCTAAGAPGSECYNTRPTCQDLANFSAVIVKLPLCARGMRVPLGETYYPYIESVRSQPTRLDPERGLANRANVVLTLLDDAIADTWQDPYIANRSTPAGSTFWPRFMSRNKAIPGKFVEVLKGYDVDPWDWGTFVTELYSIDALDGPDTRGNMRLTLKDPTKVADDIQLPIPTRGKLLNELPQYDDIGTAQGGTANTIVLQTEASAIDDYYNDMAVNIYDQTGAGQERVITGYVGATRTATVASNWSVNPDSSSLYFVQQLSVALDANGPDYDAYGVPGHFRVGKEIIKFSARAGEVLSWPDTSYRAQFNTPLEDHKTDGIVQVCKVFADEAITDVIMWFYTEAGLDVAYIDTAGFAAVESAALGLGYNISAPISTPRKASDYVKDLLNTVGAMTWWNPQTQQVKMFLATPQPPGSVIPVLTDGAAIISDSMDIKTLNDVRLTLSALFFDLNSATANVREASNFANGAVYHDQDALDEYGIERTDVIYSQFFYAGNAAAARDIVARAVTNRRDPPLLIKAQIHPKDYSFTRGDYRDFLTDKTVDINGNPKLTRAFITMIDDQGDRVLIEARSTTFDKRYAFFAPDGTPDYPLNNGYACFCQNDGLMTDGSSGYLFI